MKSFYETMEERRSYYSLDANVQVSDVRLAELMSFIVKHTPSAFNSQSGRLVLLLKEHHQKLWDITLEELKKFATPEQWTNTKQKIAGFRAAYGTILFYNDDDVTLEFTALYPLYKNRFAKWAQHANAMMQFAAWNLLEAEGLGASLQHYDPLIDERVAQEWNIPKSYHLIAQMPFGNPTAPPAEKEFLPIGERVRIFD